MIVTLAIVIEEGERTETGALKMTKLGTKQLAQAEDFMHEVVARVEQLTRAELARRRG